MSAIYLCNNLNLLFEKNVLIEKDKAY